MGAAVLYTPVSTRRSVKGGSTSAWTKTCEIWGDSPLIRETDLPTLRALRVADTMYADYWQDLEDLVTKHGAVQLDAEY